MTSILLIQCADRIGLVATLAQTMAEANSNIVSMREYVDEENMMFFCRMELHGPFLTATTIGKLNTLLPYGVHIVYNPQPVKNIVVLVSKEHHCLADLLVRNHFGTLPVKVQSVIGNHKELGDICKRFDVPFFYINTTDKTKQQFEGELMKTIEQFKPDLLVLAKFMRILSPDFVGAFTNRVINIHHSFLQAFIGANPYKQAYQRGVKLIGATAHFVTNDLDEGPIISQQIIEVNHSFTAKNMSKAGKEVETAVLARALKLAAENRILVWNHKTVIFE